MPPPGFIYQPDVFTLEEEEDALREIASLDLAPVMFRGFTAKRRAIHFGVGYDFDDRALVNAPGLPPFLLPIRQKAAEVAGHPPDAFTEGLVMEYPPGAVIGWHRDAPKFGPVVLGVSLAADARMRFKKVSAAKATVERASLTLQRRSVYALTGEARSVWYHSIPAVDALRYSITFRTIR
jgi:alkylated DNA repair dioxygenase AlkB